MLFFTAIGAFATGAAAIMSWAARSDSLKAEKNAETAQERAEAARDDALSSARQAASALTEANRLKQLHFEARVSNERQRDRAQWGSLLRSWAATEMKNALTPIQAASLFRVKGPSFEEVSTARIALDDAHAVELQGAVQDAVSSTRDEIRGLDVDERRRLAETIAVRMVAVEDLIAKWVNDPEGMSTALRDYRLANGKAQSQPSPDSDLHH